MRLDDDGLIQLVHKGVFETPLWGGFLRLLHAKSQARYVAMHFRPVAGEAERTLHFGTEVGADHRAMLTNILMSNAFAPPLREGRAYALEELAAGDVAQVSALRQALGFTDMRCIRIAEPDGQEVWLSLWGGRDIGPTTSALLVALAPHIRIALRTLGTLDRERFRSAVTGAAIEKLKMGWLTLDYKCQILEATDNIEQLFQWGSLLRRGRYNRLVPASPAIDRQMTALVKSYGSGEGRAQAFTLSQDPWIDMLVTPIRDAELRERGLSRTNAAAVVYISGDRRSEADRCDQLVELFGLLPSEARLAWMLAQASSIKEAAAALNLTEETARNYSKKIYAKTGARGQAELVRIVLTSVLALS